MSRLAQIKGMPKLLHSLRAYPRFIEKQAQGLVEKNTRLLVSSSGKVPGLVQVTPPHSDGVKGNKAKKQGESAVMRDVWQVYATPGKLHEMIKRAGQAQAANAFWSHIKRNEFAKAETILKRVLGKGFDSFDDGAAHMARRNRQGRVSGKRPTVFLRDGRPVEKYIKRRQRNVGLLAASIPSAYSGRFGPLRGVPSWIARHQRSWASGSMIERRSMRRGLVIRISINGGALNGEMQRRFTYVVGYRNKAMERETPFVIRYAAKQAGLLA